MTHPGTENPATIESTAGSLAELARTLQRQPGPQAVMDRTVESAVALVDGAAHGSISLVHGRRVVESAAATDDVARAFDRAQGELGEGPCLTAMYDQLVVRVERFEVEPRWPGLARAAADIGVHSALCFQLFVHGSTMGGLNLLSPDPEAFTDDSVRVGEVFAAHAAVALAGAQELDDLSGALANRDVIGQAKGILMERFRVTAEQAFALLAKVSQDRNVKLHVIAEELTRSGTLRR